MNYARVREVAKKKIESKKQQLSVMSGEDRTKLEAALVNEAQIEVDQEEKLAASNVNEGDIYSKHESSEQVAGYDPGHQYPHVVDTQAGEVYDDPTPKVVEQEQRPKHHQHHNRQHKRR